MFLRAAALAALPLAIALPARAQSFEGPVTGTLDCPARSLFDSGSTPVRGQVRNGEMTVTLPEVVVSGRILNLGAAAVRLEGEARQVTAAFTGVVMAGGQLHARGLVGDRPCNLNLVLSSGAAPQARPPVSQAPVSQAPVSQAPVSQAPAPVPAAGGGSLDGTWTGTVNCPTRDLSDSGEMAARATVANNVLSLAFEDVRMQGRIIGVNPTPLMRLDGQGPRSGAASFDAVIVTPQRIHARGLVGQQPCNVNLVPARAVPPPVQAVPRPTAPPVQQAARPPVDGGVGKPGGPMSQGAPGFGDEKSPIPGPTPPAPEPVRPPPVASAPRPVLPGPAPAATPAPTPAPAARPPSPAAADQLACALAGTCPPPQR
ncbi:hypothetical protein [Falsiroseomonas ponticola]|uniref:hypothetical protein n=1 Tax=Falsiroseomonas ponticola TaxID=2786951 RepID=UPI001931D71E|nr:hypothetical protein [Roseomonas ponticola]